MTAARPERRAAGEIDDIAARRVIRQLQLLAERGQIQIAQHRDFSLQLLPCDIGELIEGEAFGQISHDGGEARALQNALLVPRLLERVQDIHEARSAYDHASRGSN